VNVSFVLISLLIQSTVRKLLTALNMACGKVFPAHTMQAHSGVEV
jgi:hypothetical protein